jgi:hypothetical protein
MSLCLNGLIFIATTSVHSAALLPAFCCFRQSHEWVGPGSICGVQDLEFGRLDFKNKIAMLR